MFILSPKQCPALPARLLFSPDGGTLAVAYNYQSVRLWGLDARAEVALLDSTSGWKALYPPAIGLIAAGLSGKLAAAA